MKIKTEFWEKPIPSRNYDWCAYDDSTYDGRDDPGSKIGHGPTEQAAIDDLMEQMEGDAL